METDSESTLLRPPCPLHGPASWPLFGRAEMASAHGERRGSTWGACSYIRFIIVRAGLGTKYAYQCTYCAPEYALPPAFSYVDERVC